MSLTPPGCRVVCDHQPAEIMNELVAALRALRANGMAEREARALARDPDRLAIALAASSMGSLQGVAESLIESGCVECAVDKVYSR